MRAATLAVPIAVCLGIWGIADSFARVPEPVHDRVYLPLVEHLTKVRPDEDPGEIVIDDQDTFPVFTTGPRGFCRPIGRYSRTCCLGKVCTTEHRSIVEP